MTNMKKADYRRSTDGIFVVLLTLLLSFAVCSLLLLMYKADLGTAYAAMLRGAWGTKYNLAETLSKAAPLLLVALGFAIAAQSGMFNIGGEGQMYAGALGASLVALNMPAETPRVVAIILIMVVGMLFGMLWALPVAYFKTKFGISEIVMTVMLNEVAAGIVSYLVSVPMKDPQTPMHHTPMFEENFQMPILIKSTKLHLGILVAILCVFVVWFFINKTTSGYCLKAVGLSSKAASYAGMPVASIMIVSMMISGGFGGLAGAFEATGLHHRLIESVTGNYGYTAIVVAHLGKRNPFYIAVAAFIFASLTAGADAMQRAVGTPSMLSSLIQGVTVFFWIMSEYAVKRVRKGIRRQSYLKKNAIQATA
ncbi:MAG: ABC transporter permease [Clostridia bacterium]